MNYGFQPSIVTPDNYILGGVGVPKKILNPERNWVSFLPAGEIQKRNIETSSCTEFGTLNGIETLEKRLFGKIENYSERAVAIGSGNTENGNDPHTVCEYIRKNGLLDDFILPFNDEIESFEQYLSPKPLTNNIEQQALKWLRCRVLKHEWVFGQNASLREKQEKLWESLLYSPLGVSVAAWHEDDNLYVKADDEPDNHWTLLIGGKFGEYWRVNDSYLDDGQYLKTLDWHYNFQFSKLFVINEIKRKFLYDYFRGYFEQFMK